MRGTVTLRTKGSPVTGCLSCCRPSLRGFLCTINGETHVIRAGIRSTATGTVRTTTYAGVSTCSRLHHRPLESNSSTEATRKRHQPGLRCMTYYTSSSTAAVTLSNTRWLIRPSFFKWPSIRRASGLPTTFSRTARRIWPAIPDMGMPSSRATFRPASSSINNGRSYSTASAMASRSPGSR